MFLSFQQSQRVRVKRIGFARSGFTMIELNAALLVVLASLLAGDLSLKNGALRLAEIRPLELSDRLVHKFFDEVEERLEVARTVDPTDAALTELDSDTDWELRLEGALGLAASQNSTAPSPGNGTGFLYRSPVEPLGFEGAGSSDSLVWGARVDGVDTEGACSALVFRPLATISESSRHFDINSDGDVDDQFDLGRITDIAWGADGDTRRSSQVDLSPTLVLQEHGAFGSDLDGDGHGDPIFLSDPDLARLRVRIFALMADESGRETVKRFETVLYLRNARAE